MQQPAEQVSGTGAGNNIYIYFMKILIGNSLFSRFKINKIFKCFDKQINMQYPNNTVSSRSFIKCEELISV